MIEPRTSKQTHRPGPVRILLSERLLVRAGLGYDTLGHRAGPDRYMPFNTHIVTGDRVSPETVRVPEPSPVIRKSYQNILFVGADTLWWWSYLGPVCTVAIRKRNTTSRSNTIICYQLTTESIFLPFKSDNKGYVKVLRPLFHTFPNRRP